MVCTPDLYYQEFKFSGLTLRSWKHKFLKRLDEYYKLTPEYKPKFGAAQIDAPTLLKEFEKAVARWTLSDVPVACSLSGGIDSAAITALVAKRSGSTVKTYTLGFDDAPDLDERHLAKLVAERYKTDHHEIVLSVDGLLGDLDQMVYSLDEPYGGGLPSWYVFKAMGKDVKVGLTGSGGDELFGNYGKWRPFTSIVDRAKRTARRLTSDKSSFSHLRTYKIGSLYPLYFQIQSPIQ